MGFLQVWLGPLAAYRSQGSLWSPTGPPLHAAQAAAMTVFQPRDAALRPKNLSGRMARWRPARANVSCSSTALGGPGHAPTQFIWGLLDDPERRLAYEILHLRWASTGAALTASVAMSACAPWPVVVVAVCRWCCCPDQRHC